MRPPVILVCGQDPLKGLSGHPSFTRSHARAVMRAGGEPHIFCPGAPATVTATDFGAVHCIGLSRLRQLTEEGRQVGLRKSFLGVDAPRLAAAIVRFVQERSAGELGPSLIHGISTWGYAGVLAAEKLHAMGREALTLNSVYTTIRHETDAKVRGLGDELRPLERLRFHGERFWQQRVIARYERRAYVGSRLVCVNYESVRRLFLAEYGPGAEIRRLPYSPESAFLHREGDALPPPPEPLAALEPSGAPLIVSVSRHDPRKGVDVLLRALGELRRGGVAFRACLTSGGELLETHRELARRLDLGGTTVLTGWVPDAFRYLRHADVFVLPSRQEGSGSLALLEALQAGAAIVASGIDGILEDVTDGDSALLVPPDRAGELARALSRLVRDAELRRRLAGRARETFAERFSAEAFSDGLRRTWADVGFAP